MRRHRYVVTRTESNSSGMPVTDSIALPNSRRRLVCYARGYALARKIASALNAMEAAATNRQQPQVETADIKE
jgi:hypothetical protein